MAGVITSFSIYVSVITQLEFVYVLCREEIIIGFTQFTPVFDGEELGYLE